MHWGCPSWCPLTPNLSVAPSPRTFCRHTFPLSQRRLRFGISFLAPNCCYFIMTPWEFLNIIYTSTSSSVLVFKCHQDHSFSCFLPSETFWLFHLLAFKITCLYLLLLKTSAGFPIPSSKSYIGFPLGFSGGNQ